ncbi:MAG: NAD-dependent dihydropyrimidine dehydrogenase PreA subunit [Candidatus Paceibacteria bacterium]|jgi:NAD-dependent dihydropyrimidine dehydrogenase PreA subunit
MSDKRRVLYCDCAYAKVLPVDVKNEVRERLLASDHEVEVVPDLCEKFARKDPSLKEHASDPNLVIAACFPRAVRWMFHGAGHELSKDVEVLNMRTESAEAISETLGLPEVPETAITPQPKPESPDWLPWFPVIDYDRCTNCMQCLSFCLFDVYGADAEGKIQVQNEDNCKTNCPACSRVCPDVAILFPKYGKGPINGDVVRAADIQSESMKVDISSLLGGDIYSSLRERSEGARKRFSTERDESKALLERKRCLKELKDALDIPDEVLMTLPSAGEIEERSRRAKEKTARRRAVSQTLADEKSASPQPSSEEWDI